MDDGDVPECGDCLAACCGACCAAACEACLDAHSHHGSDTAAAVACCCCVLAALGLALLLVAAYAVVVPVRVTVDEAVLGRLDLSAPGGITDDVNGTAGGSAAAPLSLSYDVSVAVTLRNRNWAMAAWRAGPLVAELRLRGQALPFATATLAGGAGRDRIRALRRREYRLSASAEGAPVALGPGAVAELARERAAGVFELQVDVVGAVRYEAHPHRRAITVTCPLRLALSTATAPAAFARVKCAYAARGRALASSTAP